MTVLKLTNPEFDDHLGKEGYTLRLDMGNGMYAAIKAFLYTRAIITGVIGDKACYEDRWCYHSDGAAASALVAWAARDFEGEPEGWLRHPASGRRVASDGVIYVRF